MNLSDVTEAPPHRPRQAPSPLLLVSPAFALAAALPWLSATKASPMSGLLAVTSLLLLVVGYPRPLPARLRRDGEGWTAGPPGGERPLRSLELLATPSTTIGRHRSFTARAHTDDGSSWIVDHDDRPEALLARAMALGVPLERRWGPADGRRLRPAPWRVVGYPWLGRERIRGVQLLLVVTLGGAWCLVLGRSTSPIGATSVALAVGSWLVMAGLAAVIRGDEVRIEATEVLRFERRRFGRRVRSLVFEWSRVRELELIENERGQTYLVFVGTTTSGESGSWSWPVEPSALSPAIEAGGRRP